MKWKQLLQGETQVNRKHWQVNRWLGTCQVDECWPWHQLITPEVVQPISWLPDQLILYWLRVLRWPISFYTILLVNFIGLLAQFWYSNYLKKIYLRYVSSQLTFYIYRIFMFHCQTMLKQDLCQSLSLFKRITLTDVFWFFFRVYHFLWNLLLQQ